MKPWIVSLACASALFVAACQKAPAGEADANEAVPTETSGNEAASNIAAADTPAPPASAPFDVAKAPISAVKLGAFPYLSLPQGYEASSEKTLDVARYPVWLGDSFQWVEGKVYDARISATEGKGFSKYELQKNIEALVQQAGGIRITKATPSSEAVDAVNEARSTFDDSVDDLVGNAVETFLIHQQDRDVWIQFVANDSYGGWGIVEAQPFVPTAKLIPADAK